MSEGTSSNGSSASAGHALAPAVTSACAHSDSMDEYVLVGGGLQNCLIALALLNERPSARLSLIERDARLGGNHTWCFHEGSVPERARPWLDRLVERRWPCHDVCFPEYRRRIDEEYSAITSARLDREVSALFARSPHARRVTARVTSLEQHSVTLDDGGVMAGELIVDARGPEHRERGRGGMGYQKFLGLELEVTAGSASAVPLLMDATVEQIDGFRFMYALPLAADRLLLEDTYYCDDPELDHAVLRERIHAYAASHGIGVLGERRVEFGVLPIPLSEVPRPALESPVAAGYAGGLFHPTTGYSFPVALRFALHLADRSPARALGPEYRAMLAEHRRQVRFCAALNRMLFRAFAPEARRGVLERFYRLPAATIRRFYALETSAADRLRILCGRPPRGFSLNRLLAGEMHP